MRQNTLVGEKEDSRKSYVPEYNQDLQAYVLCILDTEGMYPLYVKDPEAGMYKIVKTTKGNLQMVK